MCGRYAFTLPPEAMRQLFGVAGGDWIKQSFNISPASTNPIIRLADGARELAPAKWGLRPHWWNPEKKMNQPFNAMAEGVAAKPFFRDAFKHRRCVVPATAFYEWDQKTAPKTPYRFTVDGGAPFCFAGLWERWKSPEGEEVQTYTIITTVPNRLVANWHNRMPVIIDRDHVDAWLSATDPAAREAMLAPFPAHRMDALAVSPKMNSARYDGPV